jgi:hypothetical protein
MQQIKASLFLSILEYNETTVEHNLVENLKLCCLRLTGSQKPCNAQKIITEIIFTCIL